MYNEYENYMRSILGYPNYQEEEMSSTYFPYRDNRDFVDESKYENMYPEIYRILKPMIKKICESRMSSEITEDLIESMTDEIYMSVESEIDVVNVNVTTENEYSRSNNQGRSGNNVKMGVESKENEKRACCSNPMLKDLIKILLLNQIINNKPPRPNRPRPHFPPQYGPWQGRPPYRNNIDDPYAGNIY